ncbi:MAG: NAD-dependent epimerase/dehydratase family protein [Acidobacteriota bacterium]|nr:NAD-dependent epimerase/dehydratase family protein [Acidobacteriota bacterium]
MKSLVTGVAGFIGSHVASRLLDLGHEVTGVDIFTDTYPRWIKERNLARLSGRPGFHFLETDLETPALPEILRGVETVFHLAAQAGVRASWGRSFSEYIKNNIQATQNLLETCLGLPDLRRFVYASSSSVYGLTSDLPMKETSPVRPLSPYGVTKLSAEQLCFLYFKNYGVPTVSLRFFTVYGPGQRPDMAFHKFFKALGREEAIPVFGDGRQTRDFTFIDDIVAANLAAVERGRPGETYNIGGGHRETLADVIALLEDVCGKNARLDSQPVQKGDVPDTWADIDKAGRDLGYAPATDLRLGLEQEWKWIRGLYAF